MIVTNGYGRSSTNFDLYRLSATGQLYSFQTYASMFLHYVSLLLYISLVITDVSPGNGSIQGGTVLTISGQYFSTSSRYPLTVNVGDEPCTILSSNLTTIQCQTSNMPFVDQSHYHGEIFHRIK
jgi:hypothetical protein